MANILIFPFSAKFVDFVYALSQQNARIILELVFETLVAWKSQLKINLTLKRVILLEN